MAKFFTNKITKTTPKNSKNHNPATTAPKNHPKSPSPHQKPTIPAIPISPIGPISLIGAHPIYIGGKNTDQWEIIASTVGT